MARIHPSKIIWSSNSKSSDTDKTEESIEKQAAMIAQYDVHAAARYVQMQERLQEITDKRGASVKDYTPEVNHE